MLFNLLDIYRPWLMEHGLYRYLMVIDRIGFRAFLAGMLSFAIVLIFGKRVIHWLREKKIGDRALFDVKELDAAFASKNNTPTMGGVLITGSILVSTLLFADLTSSYVVYAIVVTIWMACVGGVDDWLKLTAESRPGSSRQGLYAWEKLIFQLGIGVLIGYFTYAAGFSSGEHSLAHAVNLPFQKTFESPTGEPSTHLIYLPLGAFIILTTLMMAGMSNAVNVTDGLDGLATGISAAVALGLMILAFVAGHEPTARELLLPYVPTGDELAVICAAILGACLGFLWWNCSPAQVFMGDTGALFLGGLLGYIAIVIRQEFLLLVMSGVFLIEIASVALQVGYFKWSKGKRIFLCAPYHWHLHRSGWQETTIVTRFWLLTVILVAIAIASIKVR